jgi:hypothetical protein
MLTLATAPVAPVFAGRVVLRCPCRPAHHYAFVVDELRRLRVPVLVALQATAGVTTLNLEGLRIALLLVAGCFRRAFSTVRACLDRR